MSTTYAGVTPSLPSYNPNASWTDERPVQLTRMDGHMTRTDGHVDNLGHEVRRLTGATVGVEKRRTCA